MRWKRRKRYIRQKAEKRRVLRKRALAVSAAALVLVALDFGYVKIMDGRFYHHSSVNGFDVSGKTAEEAAALLETPYNMLTLDIREGGESVLSSSFAGMGYSVDHSGIVSALEDLIGRQNGIAYAGLVFGNRYGMRVPFHIDDTLFKSTISGESLSRPRVITSDAMLVRQADGYVIQPEVYGTNFEDTDLRSLVNETIVRDLSDGKREDSVTVEIPESIYKRPSVTSDDPTLNGTRDLYNQYLNASVTYDFGAKKETVDWDTIQNWLILDQPDDPIDDEAIYDYVYQLASTYDTYGIPRTFESTYRGPITIGYNNYGYEIDVDAEASQLHADILSNTAVEREPVYSRVGYSRNGVDDLNGTYVEVDLSSQYLWFYKDGGLVVESPIISGLPTEDRATHEGVFTIPYKQSPANLVGQGGGIGETWDVEVQYWMPFDDGQGLHDANWQSFFGGSTYLTAGSHGCINLPVDVAAAIYNYMEDNVAILIYS